MTEKWLKCKNKHFCEISHFATDGVDLDFCKCLQTSGMDVRQLSEMCFTDRHRRPP